MSRARQAIVRTLRDEGTKRASSFLPRVLNRLHRDKHVRIVRGSGDDPLMEATPEGLAELELAGRRCTHVNGHNARLKTRLPCADWALFDDGHGNPRCGRHTPEMLARDKAQSERQRAARARAAA